MHHLLQVKEKGFELNPPSVLSIGVREGAILAS